MFFINKNLFYKETKEKDNDKQFFKIINQVVIFISTGNKS